MFSLLLIYIYKQVLLDYYCRHVGEVEMERMVHSTVGVMWKVKNVVVRDAFHNGKHIQPKVIFFFSNTINRNFCVLGSGTVQPSCMKTHMY